MPSVRRELLPVGRLVWARVNSKWPWWPAEVVDVESHSLPELACRFPVQALQSWLHHLDQSREQQQQQRGEDQTQADVEAEFLVLFFGDQTFGWVKEPDVHPFEGDGVEQRQHLSVSTAQAVKFNQAFEEAQSAAQVS